MPLKHSFIATPIFYANAKPHIGHAYTLCLSDAWSRFSALRHHPCLQAFPPHRTPFRPPCSSQVHSFLSTGVDEHGSKIARTAADSKCSPQELCDRVSAYFKSLISTLNVASPSTVFIRTTSAQHKATVQAAWQRLVSSNSGNGSPYLYRSGFSGWYAMRDEAFYADWEVEEASPDGSSKVAKATGSPVQWVLEETYRFRLEVLKPQLHEWLDSGVLPSDSPEHARLLALTHSTLDLLDDPSVSRPSSRVPWGIPVPGSPDQTIYVWFDALLNYLTAGGVDLTKAGQQNADVIWPPDWHFIGKDILRFHAILWPAILMALGLPLPRKIVPHGHILVEGTKMSKSIGNVVSPSDVVDRLTRAFLVPPSYLTESAARSIAADCLRYCLVRSVCLQEDTTFSLSLACNTINTELVNSIGNLLSRVTSKKVVPTGRVPIMDMVQAQALMTDATDAEFLNDVCRLPQTFDTLWWDRLQPHKAIDALLSVIRGTNAFVDRRRPWDQSSDASSTVGVALEALRLVGCLLLPTTPVLSDRLLDGLGLKPGALRCSTWKVDNGNRAPLVPRIKDVV